MGYNLDITRKTDRWDEPGPAISLTEWESTVAAHDDIRLDGSAEAPLPGGKVLSVDDPSMAVWTGYSSDGMGGNPAWIWLSENGNIEAKKEDEDFIVRMHAIADAFGARLVGEAVEAYGGDGKTIEASADVSPSNTRRWLIWWR